MLSVWLFTEMLADYFGSSPILLFESTSLAAMISSFVAFNFSNDSEKRTRLLFVLLGLSVLLWSFLLSSLGLCLAFLELYFHQPLLAIRLTFELSLFLSIGLSLFAAIGFRARASRLILAAMIEGESGFSQTNSGFESPSWKRASKIFALLSRKMLPVGFDARIITLPSERSSSSRFFSGAFDYRGIRIVSISEETVNLLDDDELEAVIAHEIAHIKSRDSLQKTIATSCRIAFAFAPVSRFIEAAIYRERELAADFQAAQATMKPESLASALIKIHNGERSATIPVSPFFSSVSIRLSKGGLLSKQPDLRKRIDRLLLLSEKMSYSALKKGPLS